MFVTVFCGVLDTLTGEFTYVNAGHNLPVIHKSGRNLYLEMAQYPVMGAVEDLPYSASRLKLQSGDAIFLYTDGVTEAAAAGRKLFGQQRLLKALAAFGSSATRQQVHGMTQENMLRFWDKLLALYFGAEDAQKLAEIKEMCDYFGLLRGALFPMKHVQIAPELKAFHVEETRKHLFPNIDKVLSAAKRLPEFFK